MFEIEALESIRRTIESLDHQIGSLYDRLDKLREPEDTRALIWNRLREYETLISEEKEQYQVQITAVRRTSPGLITEWVAGRIARLDRAAGMVKDLTASSLEASTLAFVIGSLKERWRKVAAGDDEPVIEHTALRNCP